MNSSGENSDNTNSDQSSDFEGDRIDRDFSKAVFTLPAMALPEKSQKGKQEPPVSRVGNVLSSPAPDTVIDTEQKVAESSQKRKRKSKAPTEALSSIETPIRGQKITPSQKRKRVSFLPNAGTTQQQEPGAYQTPQGKKRISFTETPGPPKRPATPANGTPAEGAQGVKSTVRKKKKKAPTPATPTHPAATPVRPAAVVVAAAVATPVIPEYPKIPSTPTYHSDKPKPISPEPVEEGSFYDLVEENNELRSRVQTLEKLDDMILEAAAPIGEIAFSDPVDADADVCDIEPIRETLRAIARPAAEACLVLLDKLTETQAEITASRAEGMDLVKFEEVDEEAPRGDILMERIGLLEESNKALGVEKDELTRLCLDKHLTSQEKGNHIMTLAGTNRRFKELQTNDKETIAKLQKEVEDLDHQRWGLEQQNAAFAESAVPYITDLERLYKELEGVAPPYSNTPPASASKTRLRMTKKVARELAGVMNQLEKGYVGSDYIDQTIPPHPETPLVFLINLVKGFTATARDKTRIVPPMTRAAAKVVKGGTEKDEVEEEEPTEPGTPPDKTGIVAGLSDIAADDPCREVKELLRDTQALWVKRQQEWDKVTEVRAAQAAADILKITAERDAIEKLNAGLDFTIKKLELSLAATEVKFEFEESAHRTCEGECEALTAALEDEKTNSAEALAAQAEKLVFSETSAIKLSATISNLTEILMTNTQEIAALKTEGADLQDEIAKLASADEGVDPCVDIKRRLLKFETDSYEKDDMLKELQAHIDEMEAARVKGELKAEDKGRKREELIATLQAEVDSLTAGLVSNAALEGQIAAAQDELPRRAKQAGALIDEIDKLKSAPPTGKTKDKVDPNAGVAKQLLELQATSGKQVKALLAEIAKLKSGSPTGKTRDRVDPNAGVKKELLELQATSGKRIKSLQAEINKLKSAPPTGTTGDEVDPCAEVKKELLELQVTSGKKDEQVESLLAEIGKLKSILPAGDDPCAKFKAQLLELQKRLDHVRRRLKSRRAKQAASELRLAESKALGASPSHKEFETRLREIRRKLKISYVRRINTLYRTRQEQMFPHGQPAAFASVTLRDLLKQDGPPIKELSDQWFATQWEELYEQVTILCQINYRGRSDHLPYDYMESAAANELLSYYLRDTVVSEHAMHDRINDPAEVFGYTYRAKVAAAIFFRILVEEIFDPIRFLLNMRFPGSEKWKTKLQFRQAFESLNNPQFPRAETRRGFQDKESWCTRQATILGREVFRPRRRKDENFNYFKEIEERTYDRNSGGRVAHQPESISLLR